MTKAKGEPSGGKVDVEPSGRLKLTGPVLAWPEVERVQVKSGTPKGLDYNTLLDQVIGGAIMMKSVEVKTVLAPELSVASSEAGVGVETVLAPELSAVSSETVVKIEQVCVPLLVLDTKPPKEGVPPTYVEIAKYGERDKDGFLIFPQFSPKGAGKTKHVSVYGHSQTPTKVQAVKTGLGANSGGRGFSPAAQESVVPGNHRD